MRIRKALATDAQTLAILLNQLGYDVSQSLVEDKLIQSDSSELSEVFVVESSGLVIGLVSCQIIALFHQRGNCGRITSLVVDENNRSKGAGKLLLAEADRYFINAECIKSEVTSGNHRLAAHAFYESCGFVQDERRFLKLYR